MPQNVMPRFDLRRHGRADETLPPVALAGLRLLARTFAPMIVVATLTGCGQGPSQARFMSADISTESIGSPFTLVDPTGHKRSLSDFRGKVVAVFFGYTQCPEVCPTSLLTMASVMKTLGTDAARVQVIFVTVDPTRDTPQILARYVPQFDPRFLGLSGEQAEIDQVAKSFKVTYEIRPGQTPSSYTIDHTAGMYVFDPHGRLRLLVRHGEKPEKVAHDLKLLLNGA